MSKLEEINHYLRQQAGERGPSLQKAAGYAAALVSGVLLGGIALSLINRKTIHALQRELDQTTESPDTDEIY